MTKHVFRSSARFIQQRFPVVAPKSPCEACQTYDHVLSQTENLARDLLRHHFPFLHAVYNSRPDWLRNPKTGRRLELDIFYPHINVAVEVQGIDYEETWVYKDVVPIISTPYI